VVYLTVLSESRYRPVALGRMRSIENPGDLIGNEIRLFVASSSLPQTTTPRASGMVKLGRD
jgi:hypothetical protein